MAVFAPFSLITASIAGSALRKREVGLSHWFCLDNYADGARSAAIVKQALTILRGASWLTRATLEPLTRISDSLFSRRIRVFCIFRKARARFRKVRRHRMRALTSADFNHTRRYEIRPPPYRSKNPNCKARAPLANGAFAPGAGRRRRSRRLRVHAARRYAIRRRDRGVDGDCDAFARAYRSGIRRQETPSSRGTASPHPPRPRSRPSRRGRRKPRQHGRRTRPLLDAENGISSPRQAEPISN